jgi:L-threonylcarbamoyladenylate synthase
MSGSVETAAREIRAGNVIIYPTDTLYGIGANALDEAAIGRVFAAKKRMDKPLSIVVGDFEMLARYCSVTRKQMALAKQLLPGPYTLLLRKRPVLPGVLTPGSNKVGVRIPEHGFAIALVGRLGFPITATSANISGRKAPADASGISAALREKAALVIDAGRCKHAQESTILDLTGKKPRIVRRGAGYEKAVSLIG